MYHTKPSPFASRWGDLRTLSVWVESKADIDAEDVLQEELDEFYEDYPEYSHWDAQDPSDMRELAEGSYPEVLYAWADGDISHAVVYSCEHIGVDYEDISNHYDGDTGEVPESCIDMDEWGRRLLMDREEYFEVNGEYYYIY